jgi:hypothetical protein
MANQIIPQVGDIAQFVHPTLGTICGTVVTVRPASYLNSGRSTVTVFSPSRMAYDDAERERNLNQTRDYYRRKMLARYPELAGKNWKPSW